MSAFVDDVRSSFDAAEFCSIVSAGVGVGRTTSSLALRDSSAVSAASAALHSFLEQATTKDPPDVIAAYVHYSPGANEIFTALRAVSSNIPLASIALDCLIAIVRYSLDKENPAHTVEAAKSVVKEVVKTRAVLVGDIFIHDQRGCAKKALYLLKLVAQCHAILAKEIVSRFNLGVEPMGPMLCSKENNFCRVPFLELLFVLLASGDFDVANCLSSSARQVLITGLRVVADRTVEEANSNKSSFLSRKEKGKKGSRQNAPLPSYVQKKELTAGINLMLAFEKHLLVLPQVAVRRTAFAYPVLELLASIAAADIPPLHVAPREVVPEHEALRKTASQIFIAIAADAKVTKMSEVVAALTHTSVAEGTSAVNFVLRVIEVQPRVARGLLEKGSYLSEQPRLSSSWFGMAAIISSCVLRLPCAISKFADKAFFAKCLSHEDPLIRHTGITIMHAFCKVVETDNAAAIQPEKFLPPLNHVQNHLKKFDASFVGAQKLLVAYQNLFCDNVKGKMADPMKLSVDLAGRDIALSEDSIRAALAATPRDSLSSILKKGYLARLVVHASRTRDKSTSKRLWFLSRDILVLTGLFPNGTETEIDIYLSFLSGLDTFLPECASALEKIVFMAWDMPYRLFDETHKIAGHSTLRLDKISLLSVASVYRLRKMKTTREKAGALQAETQLERVLQRALRTVIACQRLSGSCSDVTFLSDALNDMGLLAAKAEVTPLCHPLKVHHLLTECRTAQCLFAASHSYPRTPYLELIQVSIHFHLHIRGLETSNSSGKACGRNATADIGFVWDAWLTFRDTGPCTLACDPFAELLEDTKCRTGVVILALGRLLSGLRGASSASLELSSYVPRLRQYLTSNDYKLAISIALRMARDRRTCSFLTLAGIDALSINSDADVDDNPVLSFLQESVLGVCTRNQLWNEAEARRLVTFAVHTLNGRHRMRGKENQVSFSLALLSRLVVHEDPATCILSRICLLSHSQVELPPLSCLSFSSSNDLSVLVRHFPDLCRTVMARLSLCSSNELSASLRSLLPLYQAAMNLDLFVDVKTAVGHEHEGMSETILGKIVTSRERLCSGGCRISSHMKQVAMKVGELLVFSHRKFEDMLTILIQAKERNDGTVLGNAMVFLGNVFSEENREKLSKVASDKLVIKCLTTLTEWFVGSRLHLNDDVHVSALSCFLGVLRYLKTRNTALYSVVEDVTVLEKKLTATCSNIMKSLHTALGFGSEAEEDSLRMCYCCDARTKRGSIPVGLPLLCVGEVLGLDLVLDKAAKRSLISLNDHDGRLLLACLQRQQVSLKDCSTGNEVAFAVAKLVQAALVRLPRFGLEEEVAQSLSITEGVLSVEQLAFGASLNQSDAAIRKCMQGIMDCLRRNDGRKKFSLQDRRTGLFAPASSQVVTLFEKKRLELTCQKMLESAASHENGPSASLLSGLEAVEIPFEEPHDPVFVLQTFLCACAEACEAPGSAIMDIGHIVKDGVLAVVLTGTACDEEEVRALSYACLYRFSKVVGPVSGVPLGSASSLFKDRKQLAFLLELLQNSLHTPMQKVLPLFAVWFRTTMKIALSRAHDANKAVTFFFLRSPSMDVLDCLGLSHLLGCGSSGAEMKSTRHLALEVVKHGVRSIKDVAVLRKRKVFDALMSLGGSASGLEQDLRDEVLDTLASLLRNAGELVAHELVFSCGIVPWLLQDAGQMEEPDHVLRRRVDVLLLIATSFIGSEERKGVAFLFSDALSVMTRTFLQRPDSLRSKKVWLSIIKCSSAIISLAPQCPGLILMDLSQIYLQCHRNGSPERVHTAVIIAHQRNLNVQPQVCSGLLEETLSGVVYTASNCVSRSILALPNAMTIGMIHAFIARSFLQKRRTNSDKEKVPSSFCLHLANAMYICPTVWLTIACVCVLDLKGSVSPDLKKEADHLPAQPPEVVNLAQIEHYCTVVDRMRLPVIENLILCSSSTSVRMDEIYAPLIGVR